MVIKPWGGVLAAMVLAMFVLSAQTAAALPAEVILSYTGAEQSYTVPANVTVVGVEATGGIGQPISSPAPALDLSVALPDTPGEVFFAEVGAEGGIGSFGGGGAGGGNGGEAGGGASDVRTCSLSAASCPGGGTSLASRLVVAGGGGGEGGNTKSFGTSCGDGAHAGDAGDFTTPTVPVAGGFAISGNPDAISSPNDQPAEGGSGSGSGVGGIVPNCEGAGRNFLGSVSGASGEGASGGAGGTSASSPAGGGGGGGGGGYFGGGGGPSGQTEECGGVCNTSDGAGGAGGSSFYSSIATGFISYARSTASPSITFTPLVEVESPVPGAVYAQDQAVDATYACLHACVEATVPSGSPVDTSTPGPHSFEVSDQQQSHTPALSTVSYTVLSAPIVAFLTPTGGPEGGGRVVTINGDEFAAGATVHFGANAAREVTVNSPSSITATSPPGSGVVDVTVSTSSGTSALTPNDRFTYTQEPGPVLISPVLPQPLLVSPPPPKPVPAPVLAHTTNIALISGRVLVRLPGSSSFAPLSEVEQVPFGAVIDATNGTVSVTVATPAHTTQTGQFFDGEFVLTQGRNGLVLATLTGGNFSVCRRKPRAASVRPARASSKLASGKHVVRKLWANAHGSFSTRGNYAAGAVQGTEWLTEDLCEGTLIRVTRDKVRVTDLVRHRHVAVPAGHSYLAKPR